MYGSTLLFGLGLAVLSVVVFGLLRWLGVPAGNFLDWLVGIAAFEWLLVITTVPWNIHFAAKETLAETRRSSLLGIAVEAEDITYAQDLANRFFGVAVALHLLSALGLYVLAASGVSAVGYVGSAAALLLTFLRPVVRGAEYIFARLQAVRNQALHPREDVQELRGRVLELEVKLKQQESQLACQAEAFVEVRQQTATIAAQLREEAAQNHVAHERLARETRSAISQLSTDGQFLDHVREIIRFFKTA